jgi:E3 SUMO-protein ligase PIAS1
MDYLIGSNEALVNYHFLLPVSRKMQEPTNTVAASRSHESGHSVKPKRKPGDSAQAVKVRCPCGDSKPNDSMIKVNSHD